MNVTDKGSVYQATELPGEIVQLEGLKDSTRALCSHCGAEGPSADRIPHNPDCPEAKKKAAA